MRGSLKIFYSYIAGAGKTYAMLEAAHELASQGSDVLVGYVEPHTRPDTMALLEGLKAIEPKTYSYRNLELKDLDVDEVLRRNPDYVIIDELAHTNAEGMRHAKRYQDVHDVLNAGINVLTTLNIQHLESLHDIVKKICNVDVSESVPDDVFDLAEHVELIDIEVDELQRRLREGKIYPAAKVDKALANFFTRKKLNALREVALRRGAQRLSQTNRAAHVVAHDIVLVCLSSNLPNARLIRSGARLAKAFHAELHALYVYRDVESDLVKGAREAREADARLIANLGGVLSHVQGVDRANQIIDYCKTIGATKIVMARSQSVFRFTPSVADTIIAELPDVDIHIIPVKHPKAANRLSLFASGLKAKLRWSTALFTAACLVVATLIGLAAQALGAPAIVIFSVFVIAVLAVAYRAPSLIYPFAAVILALICYNYLFVEPLYTLAIKGRDYLISYLVMGVLSLVLSLFTALVRRTSRQAVKASNRIAVLLDINRSFAKARNEKQIVEVLKRVANDVCGQEVAIIAKESVATDPALSDKARGIATWAMENRTAAGAGTQTLSDAHSAYFPIVARTYVAGVVVVDNPTLDESQRVTLRAIISEAAVYLQQYRLMNAERRHQLEAEREQLKLTLLRGVSHDMRTPLAVIEGASATLLSTDGQGQADERRKLLGDIHREAQEMTRTIDNLLHMTQVTASSFHIVRVPDIMEDAAETAIARCAARQGHRRITLHSSSDELAIVSMDAPLIVQVIVNLLDNAIKHTDDHGHIRVEINLSAEWVQVKVIDDGTGISDDVLPVLFDDVLTSVRGDSSRGMGIGLGICKSIIEEHGGRMFANNIDGGACVGFAMPRHAQAGEHVQAGEDAQAGENAQAGEDAR